ncbi:hypothetical protein ABFS83_04G200800 [Erythranthe nasuta]
MAKNSSSNNIGNTKKNIVGIVRLRTAVERLQKSLLRAKKPSSSGNFKKGHFAVAAVDENGELKRFIVPLSFLTDLSFLRLLEKAAEEYGFGHDRALTVPCRPAELERLLAEKWEEERVSGGGGAHKWSS